MERPLDPDLYLRTPNHKQEMTASLLAWDQLPAQCQRELEMVLVMMLVKRLPTLPRATQEVRRE